MRLVMLISEIAQALGVEGIYQDEDVLRPVANIFWWRKKWMNVKVTMARAKKVNRQERWKKWCKCGVNGSIL